MSSTVELENRFITVTVTPPPPGKMELFFDRMVATEELGRPFLFELMLVSSTQTLEFSAMLGTSMTVAIQLEKEGTHRYFNGIVARMSYAGLLEGFHQYRVELRPWIWLLSRKQDCKIFQNMTIPVIIKQIFSDAGFSDLTDKMQNTANYFSLEFCVQYRESSFDFVTRLMEEAGIYYYFTHEAGKHLLVLSDDPNSHSKPDALEKVEYYAEEEEYRRKDDHLWDWQSDHSLQSGNYALTDYNFTTPSADLSAKAMQTASHPYSTFEVFDYPGDYPIASDGQGYASVRMQELSARREVLEGTGNVRLMGVGNTFTLSKYDDESQNREYLIRGAITTMTMQEGWFRGGAEQGDTFVSRFKAIPASTPYRMPRLTRRPLVPGPQTARVVGAAGDEITTDQYGRIKVKFFWDRSEVMDDNASCWIRVSQGWAGVSWGAIMIPRVGQEVIVEFLEGDPDRPIVTGRVYNATTTVPYALPDNKTMSTVKSNSSLGGDGFNELRFEDKAGSEEIFVHAQKDMNTIVLNNQTGTITQDSTYIVQKGTMATTVQTGDTFLTVSTGKLTESVKSDMATTVTDGDQTVTVSKGNLSTTVSKGNMSTEVSTGDMKTTVDQGAATLTVTLGDYKVNVSAGNLKASAAQSIELTVGGTSIKLDPSGITMSAPMVKISATGMMQLDASGIMTIGGSLVKIN